MALHQLSVYELHQLLLKKEISATDIIEDTLKRIEETEPKVSAYLSVLGDSALQRAKELPTISNDSSYLYGIPVAVKDNICVKGFKTTCASKILENFVSPYDATVIEKLKQNSAIIIGKTNLDEFAMGSSTENSRFKITKNPWDLERVPGGSSGGSIVAVAIGSASVGLGSETGGSVRQPSALCGIVGLKPTYGRVSRYGLVAYASSLDQISPTTRDVRDLAIILNVISGVDSKDSTSAPVPVPDYLSYLGKDVKNLKIGIPKEYFIEGMEKDVELCVKSAIKDFEKLGVNIEEVSLPHTEYAVACYYVLATAEASSNLARYDGVKYGFRIDNAENLLDMYCKTRSEGFGTEVKRRIMLGTYALSAGYYDAYYLKAQKVRTLIKQDFDKVFEKFDAILTPTSPTSAFKIGEKMSDPLQMYLADIFTISANLAGLCAISIPCGFTQLGLPVGLQLMAKPFDEGMLLQLSYAYEQATEWHNRKPSI